MSSNSTLSHGGTQNLLCLGHYLVLVGVQAKELDSEAIGRVDHGDGDQTWESPRGQLKATSPGQLYSQQLEKERGQLFSQAWAHTTSEGQVVEAALSIFTALCTEAIRVEGCHVFKNSRRVVSVSDAVHNTPALRNLHTLYMRGGDIGM